MGGKLAHIPGRIALVCALVCGVCIAVCAQGEPQPNTDEQAPLVVEGDTCRDVISLGRTVVIRGEIKQAFRRLYADIDVLLAPSRYGPATKLSDPLDKAIRDANTDARRGESQALRLQGSIGPLISYVRLGFHSSLPFVAPGVR